MSGIFEYVKSIVLAKTPNKKWLRLLIAIGIVAVIVMLFRKTPSSEKTEGFEQAGYFALKQNDEVYDDFYARMYSDIMDCENRAEFEMTTVIDMTQPTKSNSVILDVGSGTGNLVEIFRKKGYRIYGIDKSQSMVDAQLSQFPKSETKCGNVVNPMEFEHNTFTHICCMGMTMYNFENKSMFFRNCYHWLMSNGYLILHLVDREQYDPTIIAAKPYGIDTPQKYTDARITDSNVDIGNVNYKSEYDFSSEKVAMKETFTDVATGKIRQNEQTLFMESRDKILMIAKMSGFIVHGQVNMTRYNGDSHQYIYVLEKIM
jgi:ubiquinone/menaquinone biosynthesis C-methylase UbiE